MEDNNIEHSHIKSKLQYLLPYISLSTIAKDYFGKTRQWFYQRLNESQVNGKTVKFTQKELVTLSHALCEIGVKMQDVSKLLLDEKIETSNKKVKSLILDMDLTIINRGEVGDYKGKYITSYCKKAPMFSMYEGWNDVFSFIRNNNIEIAIVSDAHELIIKSVIAHFQIPCNCIVGHFGAEGNKKPNPFPMIKALELLNEKPENVLSFGDSIKDFKAATGAGIEHYACLWGSKDAAALKENGCRNFISHPKQIIEVLKKS